MSDILVIGGGIAGISAAARLSDAAQVTVLEAENALGYHASGRSAAMLEVTYGAPSVQALSRASVDYLETHETGYLSPRGLLLIARDDQQDAFYADMAAMNLTQINVDEARAMVPVLDALKVCFAAHHATAQDIDTDRLLQGYARTLRQNGGQILTDQKVDQIRFSSGHWQVTAGGTTHRADVLVNAGGAWADEIAALAGVSPIGIVPYRRSMARIPAPSGVDIKRWPLIFGVNESWYAKPDAGFLLVSPADEDPTEPHDAWADDLTLATGLARYEEMVTTPVTRLQSSWAGLRSFAPDRTLVLGREPEQPSFIWCAGQGGYGMQTSPAASQFIADLVLGRDTVLPEDIVAQLTPDRLR